mmetsp:Transcript_71086/g.189563  ORF Transcript_71086/g.189563 Transcript_71086/m.189563 type:complete len:218 (+) Transcript_71086:44-697(+)
MSQPVGWSLDQVVRFEKLLLRPPIALLEIRNSLHEHRVVLQGGIAFLEVGFEAHDHIAHLVERSEQFSSDSHTLDLSSFGRGCPGQLEDVGREVRVVEEDRHFRQALSVLVAVAVTPRLVEAEAREDQQPGIMVQFPLQTRQHGRGQLPVGLHEPLQALQGDRPLVLDPGVRQDGLLRLRSLQRLQRQDRVHERHQGFHRVVLLLGQPPVLEIRPAA